MAPKEEKTAHKTSAPVKGVEARHTIPRAKRSPKEEKTAQSQRQPQRQRSLRSLAVLHPAVVPLSADPRNEEQVCAQPGQR